MPHYVAAAPNPKAALALVRRLEGLVGVAVDASELERPPPTTSARSTSPCRATPRCRRSSSASSRRPSDEPTTQRSAALGETIARDFQRFLRQRGDEPARARAS